MKAVQFSRFGGPEVLETVERPTPQPGPGEVLVRMRAAGVNYFETLMRRNLYAVTPELPMAPGVEMAGEVEAVGQGVDAALRGARVAVPMFAIGRPAGGYAEYLAVDAASVVKLPEGLSFEHAVVLLVQGLTALHLVRRSPPHGRTVLVTAAAGGVGSLLLQMARRAGAARVIAVAGGREKLDVACSLGADLGVDYDEPGWAALVRDATGEIGVDIVYDTVGGAATKACLEALAPAGELVFGALGRFELDAAELEGMILRNQSLKGFALLPLLTPEGLRADLAELFALAEAGALTATVGGRYGLDQAAEAHRALEDRRSTGKVVLVP
ncbi:zinc-binding dehydrogenase [Mycobacterium sp. KBS0706]|uniref:quinone oxidoreductase family protein n=1 Tax=Mycobacterium sp. KBS0706 TaxID=2578109 RepID=UPI00110FCCD5|nr:zinc-binding dehydrogenase [Mycobacterium sp. KBS0706]TSD83710.1 zinc-binding dehydrogenase [Mycobacterium sp. KBS0706]